MIDLSTLTDEEITQVEQAMKARAEKRAPPATPIKPLNAPPPPPPAKTDADRIKDLEQQVKDLQGAQQGMRTELWKEWSVVQDQVRAELHRFRMVHHLPEEIARRAAALPMHSIGPAPDGIHEAFMNAAQTLPLGPVTVTPIGPEGFDIHVDASGHPRCVVCGDPVQQATETKVWFHSLEQPGGTRLYTHTAMGPHTADPEIPF